jgi:hypothetical protein
VNRHKATTAAITVRRDADTPRGGAQQFSQPPARHFAGSPAATQNTIDEVGQTCRTSGACKILLE